MAGVYEAEHIDKVPWLELPPPYSLIEIDGVPNYDGALGQIWGRPQIRIYRIDFVRGMSSGIRKKLQALALAFWPPGTALDPLAVAGVGQVMSLLPMQWSERLACNREFKRSGAVDRRGGALTLDVLLTEPE